MILLGNHGCSTSMFVYPRVLCLDPLHIFFRKMLKALALDAKCRNPCLELHPGKSLKSVATDFYPLVFGTWIQVQTNIFGFCCSYSSSLICPYSWLKFVKSSCSHVHIDYYWQQFWCLWVNKCKST